MTFLNDKYLVQVIIFSRDRAMQLDAVLRSFFLHCQDAEESVIRVIYKADNQFHAEQYKILSRSYPQVQFVEQKDFRQDLFNSISFCQSDSLKKKIYNVLVGISSLGFPSNSLADAIMRRFIDAPKINLLKMLLAGSNPRAGILFLVDDNIFVRNFFLKDILNVLLKNPKSIGFSLRLGRNVQYCYSLSRQQAVPEFISLSKDILKYDWTIAELDFAYPLEISSSLYLMDVITPMIMSMWFRNPNELEGKIAARSFILKNQFPELMCFDKSVTFCNPINLVQSVSNNRAGEQVDLSTDHLAELFAEGKRVNILSFDGFTSNACHQEMELIFEERKRDNF
jgi:hypothetical protein